MSAGAAGLDCTLAALADPERRRTVDLLRAAPWWRVSLAEILD